MTLQGCKDVPPEAPTGTMTTGTERVYLRTPSHVRVEVVKGGAASQVYENSICSVHGYFTQRPGGPGTSVQFHPVCSDGLFSRVTRRLLQRFVVPLSLANEKI